MNAEVITLKGEKYAVLPFAMWEKLQEKLEEIQDIADCNEIRAKAELGESEYLPSEVVNALIFGENPVKVYREYRGLTQVELANLAGLSVEMIKKIEGGKSEGSVKSLKSIAKALKVDVDAII